MAKTTFIDYNQNTPITASWLNDIDNGVYNTDGTHNVAAQTCLGWVRFNGATGAISSSTGILSVVRTGTGLYTITYDVTVPQSANCYAITTNQAGFGIVAGESANTVSIRCSDTSNAVVDPTIVCVQIFAVH